MPVSYSSRQPSNPRRHPICSVPSQWSHTVSSTPCFGAWTSVPLSAHLSIECKCTAPQIETPICTCRTTSHQTDYFSCWIEGTSLGSLTATTSINRNTSSFPILDLQIFLFLIMVPKVFRICAFYDQLSITHMTSSCNILRAMGSSRVAVRTIKAMLGKERIPKSLW